MTDIRIPTPAEIKARKARLWDRAGQPAKVDAVKEYKLAYSTEEVPYIPLIKFEGEVPRLPKATTWEILREISRATGISIDDMRGSSRKRAIVRARKQAYYELAARRRELSWGDVGKALCKDHTSAIHGVRSWAEEHNLPMITREEFKSKPNAKTIARREAAKASPSPEQKAVAA